MATLVVADLSRSGLDISTLVAAAGGGDTMPNDGKTFLAIKNGSGAGITVSAAITRTVDGVTPAAKSVTVPASATYLFGPFPVADYNDANGAVALTYSGVTSLTLKPIRMP